MVVGRQVLGSKQNEILESLNKLYALIQPSINDLVRMAIVLRGTKIENVATSDGLEWRCGLLFERERNGVCGKIAILFPRIIVKNDNKIQPERSIAVYVSGRAQFREEIEILLERIELRLFKRFLWWEEFLQEQGLEQNLLKDLLRERQSVLATLAIGL